MHNIKTILWLALLTIFIVFYSSLMYGQDPIVFEQISTKDGLPNGTINSIFRDSHGFMWFGTDDGLCKYDGYNFKIYKSDNLSIQNPQIHSIVEDSYGHIWIGTSFGLYIYDPNIDRIVPYSAFSYLEFKNKYVVTTINCLLFDSNNYLWVGSHTGIIRIKIRNSDIQNIKSEDVEDFNINSDDPFKLSDNNIYSIYEDTQHQIWISSNSNYLDRYNYQENRIVQQKIEIPDIQKSNNANLRIAVDKNEDFWISSQGYGLIYFERMKMKFTQFKSLLKNNNSIDISFIKSIMIDHHNRIWIGTDGNGLVTFDIESNEIQHIRKNIEDNSNISSNAIYSMYEDSTGIFWIGTYLMGLNKFVSNKSNFGQINSSPYSKTGLSHNIVTGFCEDKNHQIWISTDGGGLNVFDRNTYQFKHYRHDPDNTSSISTNITMALFCDQENNIWIGSYNGGLNKYDQKTQKFHHYWFDHNDTTSISSNHPWSFAQDKLNNIWVATVDAGLNLLKSGSTSFIRYADTDRNYHGPNQINNNSITQLFIDKKNRLWICTEYGLDRVDLNLVDFSLSKPKLTFNHYMHNDTTNSISFDRISCINEDDLDNIWIGTKGGGLNKLDLKTNKFMSYSVEDGLPHNIINGILFDEDNNPWISTNNGLSYFNVETSKFKNYGTSDGLQSSVFMKTSYFKTSDGMFLFGGINGFNAFYPEKIIAKIKKLKPIITDFKLFNQSIAIGEEINDRILLPKAIYDLDEINLTYEENSIAFGFSALDYSNPERIYYSYKLKGFDQNWQITDAKMRIAKYTNLAPGEYIFQVKASSNEETWKDTETSILIKILPPWWGTLLFKILAVILFITLLIVGYSLRVSTLEKQSKRLKTTVEEKTMQLKVKNAQLDELNKSKDKFFSIIAHDLKNPFSSVLSFSELLAQNAETMDRKEMTSELQSLHGSAKRVYSLLDNLLHWSLAQTGKIDIQIEKINLSEIVKDNIQLISNMANEKGLYVISNVPENMMVYADLNLINTIIRNLLTNSIKFTKKGGVSISAKSDERSIELLIKDSGVGISPEKLKNLFSIDKNSSTKGTHGESGTGLGLLICKEFIELNNGELKVESEVEKGSVFKIKISKVSPKISKS
ncbi:MAG: hypothetical protein KDC90_09545 [Ignavibacteriae bacterium]|nr:hypothetical protein [Ignavibacteriota bacterium]